LLEVVEVGLLKVVEVVLVVIGSEQYQYHLLLEFTQ
jgi:nicotinamide mononucleotide adenylyltransferase